jgi:hypothetical protein
MSEIIYSDGIPHKKNFYNTVMLKRKRPTQIVFSKYTEL